MLYVCTLGVPPAHHPLNTYCIFENNGHIYEPRALTTAMLMSALEMMHVDGMIVSWWFVEACNVRVCVCVYGVGKPAKDYEKD